MKAALTIFFLLFGVTLFSQIDSINLWECISAGKENMQVQQNLDYNNQTVDLQQQNLKTNYYPTLKLIGQATYQSTAIEIDLPIPNVEMPSVPLDQYKAYLEVNQLIYDGGLTKSHSNILDLTTDENLAKSQIQEKQIENNIAQIFFLALLLDKQIDIIENQLKSLNEQLTIVESSVKNDVLTPVNRDIMKSEILKIEQKLDETIILKESTLKVLEQNTGQVYSRNAKFISPSVQINPSDTGQSPRIDLYDINSQKLMMMDKQISASRKPMVYAFAQGGYGRPGLNMLSDEFSPYYLVGVTFSWTIYDWNNSKRNKQINAIKNQQIKIEKQNTELNINVQKENILAKMNTIKQAIEKDKQIIELREKILKTYKSQLKHGIITSSDYVIEVNKLSQAQLTLELHKIQLEQLKFEYNNVF